MKKILIFGTGSIALRHYKLLKTKKVEIFFYTKKKNFSKNFKIINLKDDIIKLNPDFFIIASKTNLHFEQLRFIEQNFSRKKILVEKPLFSKYQNFKIKKNDVFVGYQLRYHPIIDYLKKRFKREKTFLIKINCNSYLPEWRKNIEYHKSYSAKKKEGGGVLSDLSHEIDYVQYIFGKIDKINFSLLSKISNLRINSEDIFHFIGSINKSKIIINLDYFSKFKKREIEVISNKNHIRCDLIKNIIEYKVNKKLKKIKFKLTKNYTYLKMFDNIFFNKDKRKISCGYKEGLNINRLIDKLKSRSK